MKNIITLLSREVSAARFILIMVVNLLAGFSGFAFIKILNDTLTKILHDQPLNVLENTLAFFVAISVLIVSKRVFTELLAKISMKLYWNIRNEVVRLTLEPNYDKLKSIKHRVFSVLLTDIGIFGNSAVNVSTFVTSSFIIIACFVYMFSMSWQLTLLTLGTTMVGIFLHQRIHSVHEKRFMKVRELENDFVSHFSAILNGYKEFMMDHTKRSNVLSRYIMPLAEQSRTENIKAMVGLSNSMMLGQIIFNVLIVGILVSRVNVGISGSGIVAYMFTLIFLFNALETLMVLLPALVRLRVAADNIVGLQEDLGRDPAKKQVSVGEKEFEKLTVEGVSYEYRSEEQHFRVGPVSLEINRGESVFIYGGNGSGKTTLIYTMLGLLNPDHGRVILNSTEITKLNVSSFRDSIGVVFSDFHLFGVNYSGRNIDPAKAKEYLKLFEIDHKVTFVDNYFSTTELSMGQRKRLALILVLLENKQLIILDEWAADQDPYFRNKFYHTIIPYLKTNEEKTIIAITHDDRYFDTADKLYKMEHGKMFLVNRDKLQIAP